MSAVTKEVALQAFQGLVVALSGFSDTTVLLANGDQGRPQVDHLTLTEINDLAQGFPYFSGADMLQRRVIRFQIDGYGEQAIGVGATTAIYQLATMLRSSDARVAAQSEVFAIQSVGDASNLTTSYHSGYEPRAMVEVQVLYEVIHTNAIAPTIATQIDLSVESDGAVVVDFTLSDV